MKWALNTYQTCQDWELKRILDTAEATGYHGVELLMDYKQKHGFEWDTPENAWDGLKSQVDSSGVGISSLTSCQNFHSENVADREETGRRVSRVIDMAEFMGCDHVRVLGDRYSAENRDAVVDYVTEGLKSLGNYAGEKGITVSIEMHGSFTDPDSAMEVIEGVNLPNVVLSSIPNSLVVMMEVLNLSFHASLPMLLRYIHTRWKLQKRLNSTDRCLNG